MSSTIKRFYKLVAVAECSGGFSVTLDGRVLKTPAKLPLVIPTAALAQAVAAEWDAQVETIKPSTMPLTQLISTAIDRFGVHRAAVIDETLNYIHTDLVCYRAPAPQDLVARQTTLWHPLVDWMSLRYGVALVVTDGVMPIVQPAAVVASLRAHVDGYDDLRLSALQSATAACGSLVLALALAEGRLSAEEAYAVSQLDETYQIEFWGEDPEATARRTQLRFDVAGAGQLIALLG